MKFKITNHSELRKRQSLDVSLPKKTDQSSKAMCDINNIMLQYSKTGLLPSTREKVARYIDNTKIMALEDAHELIRGAENLFMELPAQIRKLMDNNPTKLVEFVSNPDNKEILVKYGMLEEKLGEIESHEQPSADKKKIVNAEQKETE